MSYSKALPGVPWIALVPGGTNPDPIHLAEIESLDWAYTEDTADLENADGDVIDTFTTKRVLEGTVSLKSLSNSLIAAATRGASIATGSKIGYSQTATVPGSVAYTIQVTNYSTFADDLGVIDLTAGVALQNDTAAAPGKYSLSSGTYTFDIGAASHVMLINYRATAASTGTTATVAAQAASTGSAKYALHGYRTLAGKSYGIYIPQAVIPGLSAKLSKGGWSDVSLKFKATLDASGNLAYHYGPE